MADQTHFSTVTSVTPAPVQTSSAQEPEKKKCLHLPTELLQDIFREVDCNQTLLNIVRASKRFNEIVTPFLYGVVAIAPRGYPCMVSQNIRLFTATCLERPDLTSHTKHFVFRLPKIAKMIKEDYYHTYHGSGFPIDRQSEKPNQRVKEALENSDLSENDKSFCLQSSTNVRHNYDGMISTILLRTPNLETLDIELNRLLSYSMLFGSLWEDTNLWLPNLKSLFITGLDVTGANDEYCYKEPLFGGVNLHGLPPVESVYLHKVDCYYDNFRYMHVGVWEDEPGAYITHLEIRDCKMDEKVISRFLSTCSNLRTCIHETTYVRSSYWGDLQRTTTCFLHKHLSIHQKDSLENLSLDHVDEYRQNNSSSLQIEFEQFSALKRLRVRSERVASEKFEDTEGRSMYGGKLTGNRFPATLEELELTECHGSILLDLILNLLRDKQSLAIPALQSITLDNEWIYHYRLEVEEIKNMALSAGVHLYVGDRMLFDETVDDSAWGWDAEIKWTTGSDRLNKARW